MAFYQLQSKQDKKKGKEKTVGIALLVLCVLNFLFLFTSLVPFMKSFLLGMFGLFAYPMFITLFFVSVALINQKKYVMPKKYLVFLSVSLVFLLCLIQLMILGRPEIGFWGYLGKSYTQGLTAGGILISLITAPMLYLLDELAAYIIFIIGFIISVALVVDYIYYLKKDSSLARPLSLFNIINKEQNPKQEKSILKEKQKEEAPKITLDAQIEREQKENFAKIKLGLLAGDLKKEPEVKKPEDPYTYIMTPREPDLSLYSQIREKNANQINQNISSLKQENAPQQVVADSQVKASSTVVHDQMPEFIVNNRPQQAKKPFLQPIQDFINEETPNDQQINDRTDEILKDLLDSTKPIEIDVNPVVPTTTRRGSLSREPFTQLTISGDEKQKPQDQHKKTYALPPRYVKPPIDLLNTIVNDTSAINDDVVSKRIQLEDALELFKIPAKVIGIVVGPAVTRYEIEMPPGISVKKILTHSDDIALALAAKGDIRIEAPIPGKSAVGIEVPNDKIATVGIKEILNSPEFTAAKDPLTLALGKDINGQVKVCNLQKMPHLLVAGATNSGKSVCLNSIIISLIYKTSPDDVKLILIDPKRVEFAQYNNIPHLLLSKVITESDKAINAFNWAINEMERRFQVFMDARVRNLDEYNSSPEVKSGEKEKFPYIVIIVDELADLLTVSKKEAEEKIMRLAQKARACGIHLILATQRPSVDVITGTIKANFPSRIAFMVTSYQDSRTILDQGGADKLLGKGDMLYSPSDVAEPVRIQGCFVSTKEVQDIVDFVKENNEVDHDSKIEDEIFMPKSTGFSVEDQKAKGNSFDPLMKEALKIVMEIGNASISLLQRKLVIGFPRAARIIDQMETAGYISPSDGSKPRTVFISQEELDNLFKDENE
ncbi:MAG: DNA translocase FtsK [Christensenellales bacterium]